jgi:DNA-binding NtrC family response regulator
MSAAIDRGVFRSDLLYRLDVIRIEMPPLADRAEDIPLLVQHFCAANGGNLAFDPGAMALLMAQPWPGNVRELKNVVDRTQAHCAGTIVTADRLSVLLRPAGSGRSPRPAAASPPAGVFTIPAPSLRDLSEGGVDLKRILNDLEAAYIAEALSASGGGIAASAKLLGLQRTTLIEKMRRLQIGTA